jgi:hypothetical protein
MSTLYLEKTKKEKKIYFLWDFEFVEINHKNSCNVSRNIYKDKMWYSYIITSSKQYQLKLLQKNNKFFEILDRDFIKYTIPNDRICKYDVTLMCCDKQLEFHKSPTSIISFSEDCFEHASALEGKGLDSYLGKMIFINNLIIRFSTIFNLPTDIIHILYKILWLK